MRLARAKSLKPLVPIKGMGWNLALLTFLLVALGGCDPTSSSIQANQLRVQLPTEPVSLDPSLAMDGASLQVLNNIGAGLMGYTTRGVLEPRLAESYTVSKEGKEYSFKLRKGLKWSDGVELKAEDFVTAFRRALSSKTLASLAPLYYGIKGANAYHHCNQNRTGNSASSLPKCDELGVRVENHQLIITLEKKIPSFIHSLTLPLSFPLRQDVLELNAQGGWPESAPASGPYQIASHQFEQSLVLVRNPNYYDQNYSVDQVEYKITAESTAINLFDQGMLDLVTRIPEFDLPRLKKQGLIHVSPYLATYYLSFNLLKPPFNQAALRRAVAGSIQREELVKIIGGGILPAWSWIPQGLEGYIPYRRDPQVVFAKSVQEVLLGKVAPSIAIEATFDTSSKNQRIMEKVQQDLKKSLKMDISLISMSWKAFNSAVHSDPSPLFRYGWMAPFMDPITHLKVFTTGNMNNYSGFSHQKYDALVDEIEQLEPGRERELKIFAAQKILLEDQAVVVPLYHYVQQTAVSRRIKEFQVNEFGIIQFKDLKI